MTNTVFVRDIKKGTYRGRYADISKMTVVKELDARCKPELWTEVDASIIEPIIFNAAETFKNEYYKTYTDRYNNGALVLSSEKSPVRKAIREAMSGKSAALDLPKTAKGKIDKRTKAYRAALAAGLV